MRRFFAVIDTNVLISAALRWKSVPGSIVELAFSGIIIPVISEEILSEYREVLSRPKFGFPKDVIEDIISGIRKRAISIDAESIDVSLPDPKDIVFYEVTMEVRKHENAYLVTGNLKHFPIKPFIVSPREMLDIVLEEADKF